MTLLQEAGADTPAAETAPETPAVTEVLAGPKDFSANGL